MTRFFMSSKYHHILGWFLFCQSYTVYGKFQKNCFYLKSQKNIELSCKYRHLFLLLLQPYSMATSNLIFENGGKKVEQCIKYTLRHRCLIEIMYERILILSVFDLK